MASQAQGETLPVAMSLSLGMLELLAMSELPQQELQVERVEVRHAAAQAGKSDAASSTGGAFGGGGGGGFGGGAAEAGGAGGAGGLVITIYATSSPNAAGNDYAEMFPVSSPGITAGDIVAVDVGMPVSMKLAVAGEARRSRASSPPIRASCLATRKRRQPPRRARRPRTREGQLEGGPIAIGDRIAPSSVPGVGKKAGPFDDCVGIALSAYNGSEADATVVVMIDLQQGLDINSMALTLLANGSPLSASARPLHRLRGAVDFVGGVMSAIAARFDALAANTLTYSQSSSTAATSTGSSATSTSSTATSTASSDDTSAWFAATTTPQDAFASKLVASMMSAVGRWLGSAGNGLDKVMSKEVVAENISADKVSANTLCLGSDCRTSWSLSTSTAAQVATRADIGAATSSLADSLNTFVASSTARFTTALQEATSSFSSLLGLFHSSALFGIRHSPVGCHQHDSRDIFRPRDFHHDHRSAARARRHDLHFGCYVRRFGELFF